MSYWIDIIALILAALILLRGMSGGLARAGLDLAVLFASLFGARFLLRQFVYPWIGATPPFSDFAIFSVVWIVFYIVLAIASRLLFKIVKIQFIPPLEQVGGIVLGAVKLGVLLTISVSIIQGFPPGKGWIDSSYALRMGRFFRKWIPLLPDPLLPGRSIVKDKAEDAVDAVRKVLEKELKIQALPKDIEEKLREIPKKL